MTCPRLHRRRGFSLVELLVVIALIAILASLLLPALRGARQCAVAARCASNLRQFGLAAQMYWDDHEGMAFRYRGGAANDGDLFWFGWLQRGDEGHRRFDPTPGVLWPYLANRQTAVCAALRSYGSDFKAKAAGGTGGYGYNLALAAPADHPPVRIASINNPAECVVFADAAQINDFQAPASPEHPLLEEFYYVSPNEPTAHFRHRLRCNLAFADGHAAPQRPMPDSWDPRLPQARVGKLPTHLLAIP